MRPVPERHHLVGVRPDGGAKGPRQPKVGQLGLAGGVDQQVLRLEVTVQHAVGVAKCDAGQQLLQVGLEPVEGVEWAAEGG